VVEEQDIVYRGEGPPASGSSPAAGAGPRPADEPGAAAPAQPAAWAWTLPIEPTLLFRFSALTYNAHRIHYDRQYATEVEGYPGLVVHGPLQAVALAELCRRNCAERPLAAFRFRAVSPTFDDGPVRFEGRPDASGDAVALAASAPSGTTTMEASAVFAARR
jgi:3-methylfumaryl-CoA hydratase